MNQSTYFNYNLPQPNDMADVSKINTNFINLDAFLHRTVGEGYSNPDTLDARVSAVEAGVDLEKSATNSFDDGIDSYFKKVVSSIVPVQAGSGTPSPTNVRAISGFTECEVKDFGRNFMPQKDVSVPDSQTNQSINIDLPKGTYTISARVSTDGSDTSCRYNVRVGTTAIAVGFLDVSDGRASSTFTIDQDCDRIYLYGGNATSTQANTSYTDIQIERGTTATDYTPYVSPTTATISFGIAGTVYGGEVDLTTGVLTVNMAGATYNGSENWDFYSSSDLNNVFVLPGAVPSVLNQLNQISNLFRADTNAHSANDNRENTFIQGTSRNLFCQVAKTTAETATDFKTFLQTNPLQVVYNITPQTYQLTPAQLRSLVGANNLTSSTGEVTETEYITNQTIAWLLDLIRAN